MSWGEFVAIDLTRFKAGEYPWTRQEFYEASSPKEIAAHTVDPIVIDMYGENINGDIRVAENDEWWVEGYLWSTTPPPLGDDYKLLEDVTRLSFYPVSTFSKDKNNHMGLIEYEMFNMGLEDVFSDCVEDIIRLCDGLPGERLGFITLWECNAGKDQDTPNGPGEYFTDYWLVGMVTPLKDRVDLRRVVHESDS